MVSTPIRSTFSIMCGTSLSKTGDDSSRHGFVFIYISHGLNSSSTMKSSPKSSKFLSFSSLLRASQVDLTAIAAIYFILGMRTFERSIVRPIAGKVSRYLCNYE